MNALITVALIGVLVSGLASPAPTFLVGTALLLVINFASLEDQSDVLRRHADGFDTTDLAAMGLRAVVDVPSLHRAQRDVARVAAIGRQAPPSA